MVCLQKPSPSMLAHCHCPGCGTQQSLHAKLHSFFAGRGPNNNSLHPPLAAVIVVAPKGRGDCGFSMKRCRFEAVCLHDALAPPLGELDAKRPERVGSQNKKLPIPEDGELGKYEVTPQ